MSTNVLQEALSADVLILRSHYILRQYAKDDVSDDEVEVQLIFDTERDHYQWMNVGWVLGRLTSCTILKNLIKIY